MPKTPTTEAAEKHEAINRALLYLLQLSDLEYKRLRAFAPEGLERALAQDGYHIEAAATQGATPDDRDAVIAPWRNVARRLRGRLRGSARHEPHCRETSLDETQVDACACGLLQLLTEARTLLAGTSEEGGG